MLTPNELIAKIDALPQRLSGARMELALTKKALSDAEKALDEAKAEALSSVVLELNEQGKPRYSNKEAREAAVQKIMTGAANYREFMARHQRLEIEKQNAEINVGLMEDEQQSLHAQLEAALASMRSETIRELAKTLGDLVRLEGLRLAQKEASHA